MSFEPTEEQRLVQQTARDVATRTLAPRAAERDRLGTFPEAELRQLASLGLLGVNVPPELGGSGAGVVSYSLALTELARACASTSVAVAVTNMAAELICQYGSEEQRQRYVTRLVSGEALCAAFALSEPHCGSDAAALRTTARRTDRGWVLSGTKQWITSGDRAGLVVVWARTGADSGPKGISVFVVERGTPGLLVGKHEEKLGLRGSTTVALTFEDCELPADALLGPEGSGFSQAMTALDGGRIGIGSQALGIGLAARDEAVRYAKERQAFGHPIADRQAIQWMLADSQTELEAARLLTLRAAWLKERRAPFTREASMAKLYASEAANRVCYRALQIHGGYGYTKDFAVERLYRDVRITTIYEGTSEIQRLVIGRSLVRD
ncbi:MAG: acyl-CoA dehydrogenase family protein [Deltaproteobacteria bacterium]|nr:acyl-CoA dehydrogenase family protein [Deltaproteobacteria bacterium]